MRMIRAIRAGVVWVNTYRAMAAQGPFGGVKNSGFGREGGRFSMEEMTELKWITIQSGQRAFPM